MMKKLTALLLALLMLGTLATAQAADYSGTWYLISVEAEGIAINPADMGMEMTMLLNPDGTGKAASTGEEDAVVTWTLDGDTLTVSADGVPLDFTMNEDGQLIAETDSTVMTFGREPAQPGFIAAAEIAAEDVAAFDGTWTITTVNAYGMVVPFSAMAQSGMENDLIVIDNGSVTSFDAAEAVEGTFANGKLTVPSDMGEEFGQTLSLLEDGTMSVTYMGIIFYCEKTEIVE